MLLHKTPQNKRTTYTYHFTDGVGAQTVTLRPGENGVTELDIEKLHMMDDREVEHNLKAINPEMSLTRREHKELRAKKDAWAQDYIKKFEMENNYTPNDADITAAVNEAFPKNWLGSIEEMLDNCDDGNDTFAEKAAFLADKSDEEEIPGPVERMREIVSSLSPNHQGVYRYVICEEMKKNKAAKLLGISDTRVSQITKELMKIFAEDEILKKFFR